MVSKAENPKAFGAFVSEFKREVISAHSTGLNWCYEVGKASSLNCPSAAEGEVLNST